MKASDGLRGEGLERAAQGAGRARMGTRVSAAIRAREELAHAAAASSTDSKKLQHESLQCAAVGAEEQVSQRARALRPLLLLLYSSALLAPFPPLLPPVPLVALLRRFRKTRRLRAVPIPERGTRRPIHSRVASSLTH